MPVSDLPRVSQGVPLDARTPAVASVVELSAPGPRSGLGVALVGSTMAGGTGAPWVRDAPFEKHSDARARRVADLRAKKSRAAKVTAILVGVGLATLAASASLIAAGGGDGPAAPARAAQVGAAGPRGGGAAVVWKIGFR